MNITKLLIGTIVGGIVFFLLGWLVYGNLLAGFMSNNTGKIGHSADRREMEFLFIIIGNGLQGLLLAYIFVKSNTNTLVGGLITGGIIGFLVSASVDCLIYGTTFMLSKKGIAADVAAATVIAAIAGAAIALTAGGKGRSGSK